MFGTTKNAAKLAVYDETIINVKNHQTEAAKRICRKKFNEISTNKNVKRDFLFTDAALTSISDPMQKKKKEKKFKSRNRYVLYIRTNHHLAATVHRSQTTWNSAN